jgi:hypothetical protein
MTPNRSILDDHENEESTTSTGALPETMNRGKDNPSPIRNEGSDVEEENNRLFDESFNGNNSIFQNAAEADQMSNSDCFCGIDPCINLAMMTRMTSATRTKPQHLKVRAHLGNNRL